LAVRAKKVTKRAKKHDLSFPYVVDEMQAVARGYDAVCTPEFFGFNTALELQHRGRLDASRTTLVPDARRELFEAMCRIAETGEGPAEQRASMGCSIKWRE
jgi:peroxiredoxin